MVDGVLSAWFLDSNHAKVIQQIELRKKDLNLTLHVRVVTESQNCLSRYMAVDGVENRNQSFSVVCLEG